MQFCQELQLLEVHVEVFTGVLFTSNILECYLKITVFLVCMIYVI